jgi:hypothetical protein
VFANTILFSEMSPDPAWEAEFNDWYDQEHIPVRMAAPGFVSAQRYRTGERGYLAVYEMDSPAALRTEVYERIKTRPSERTRRMLTGVSGFTRYIGNEIATARRPDKPNHNEVEGRSQFSVQSKSAPVDTPFLYAVWFAVPPGRLADFDAWYDQDHVPILMQQKDWIAVRRFDIVDGEPESFNRLALHYLADAAALDRPEQRLARETPWRQRLAAEPWFNGRYNVFERHGTRQKAVK